MQTQTQVNDNGRPAAMPPSSAADARPMRQRVTFEVNVPRFVTLDGQPKFVAGRYGDQWQYFLRRQ